MDSEFTEAENKLINELVNVDPGEDLKELAVCKAKLVVAEQTVAVLEAQLEQVTRKLEDEGSRTMLAYIQMNELNNKLKSAELQRLEKVVQPGKTMPGLDYHHKKPSLFPATFSDDNDDEIINCFRLDDDMTCKIL